MIDRGDSHYETVPGLSRVAKDQVPGNGKTWEIVRFVGAGAYVPETAVMLVWDRGGAGEEVLASTHGDANVEMVRQVAGDGVKKLALVLENDGPVGFAMGGRYEAREL